MNEETLWDTVPDAPALPLSERETLFAWGKAHGFPEFHFDIKGTGGGIREGKAHWEEMLDSHYWEAWDITSDIWFKYAIKAIREAKAVAS